MVPKEGDPEAESAALPSARGGEPDSTQLALGGDAVPAAKSGRDRRGRTSGSEAAPATRKVLPAATSPLDAGPTREQEFFIPVHGEVRLRPSEVAVVDHPAFQRLGDIFQLGQTYLVYRGATHKRLEHALGALHVAHLMIQSLEQNAGADVARPGDVVGTWNLGTKLRPSEVALTRLGALLHDVGHLAAGHTLEDELGVLDAHDGDKRLDLVLDRREWHSTEVAPTLREVIDTRYHDVAAASGLCDATGKPLPASRILALLISKDQADYKLPSGCEFRLAVCRDIIGNTICADLLDYLHRDWLHLGKRREFDKRLLGYMEIRSRVGDPQDSRLVINLRGAHRLRTDAVTAILDLLESRYQLAEIALFHRTKCCAAAMLERVVAEVAASDGSFLQTLPEKLLDRSDSEMLGLFEALLGAAATNEKDKDALARLQAARRLAGRLRHRQIYKEFIAYPEFKLADMASDVQERYGGPRAEKDKLKRAQIGAANRLLAVRQLEADFGMQPCSLVMYCPPRKMNTKIADVQVLVHGDVYTLDNFESDHGDHGVTGGHLKAQKERFRRLWRVVFAIEQSERERLQGLFLLEPLGRAIGLCVLRMSPPTGTIEASIWSMARELTTREGSPLHGGELVDEALVAARGHAITSYPGGAPSLLAYIAR